MVFGGGGGGGDDEENSSLDLCGTRENETQKGLSLMEPSGFCSLEFEVSNKQLGFPLGGFAAYPLECQPIFVLSQRLNSVSFFQVHSSVDGC